jgi:carbamate kinase
MGPKVEACCRFVEATGGRAAIGSLAQMDGLLAGRNGTQVRGRALEAADASDGLRPGQAEETG